MTFWIMGYVVGSDRVWHGLSVAVSDPPSTHRKRVYDGNVKASYRRRKPVILFPAGGEEVHSARARFHRSNRVLVEIDPENIDFV